MRNPILLFCLLPVFVQTGFSQVGPPVSQTIGTGTVEVRIQSTGPLLSEFRIPGPGGDTSVPAIKDLLLWFGAIDPAGNICLALQNSNPDLSSFKGGFANIPNSAGVWKVTKAQIDQHLQDFAEDGDIDTPIPAIFSWPARGNPFSLQLNGFSVDSVTWIIGAPFKNNDNGNGFDIYDPAAGDYPTFGSWIIEERPPTEIAFMPFFQREVMLPPPYLFTPKRFPVQANVSYYAFDCDQNNYLDNSILGVVNFQSTAEERLDSVVAALVIDGDIGFPNDDYMGTRPGRNQVYFYNSTKNDLLFGNEAPVVGLDLISGIMDTLAYDAGLNTIMPQHYNYSFPIQTSPPQQALEYYRYMTGSWRDGTPLTEGGTGLNLANPNATRVPFPFTGDPSAPDEWSEQNAHNEPGDRGAVLSTGPVSLKPLLNNRFIFSLFHIPGGSVMQENLATMDDYSEFASEFLYGDYFPPGVHFTDTLDCLRRTTSVVAPPDESAVHIFPNPAQNSFMVSIENQVIKTISLYDMLGRPVAVQSDPGPVGIEVHTRHLPNGVYLLSGVSQKGQSFHRKIIINR